MIWKKVEDSCFSEWELYDSLDNKLLTIGWYELLDKNYKKVRTYKVYHTSKLSFLFDWYMDTRTDIRIFKKLVENKVILWAKTLEEK